MFCKAFSHSIRSVIEIDCIEIESAIVYGKYAKEISLLSLASCSSSLPSPSVIFNRKSIFSKCSENIHKIRLIAKLLRLKWNTLYWHKIFIVVYVLVSLHQIFHQNTVFPTEENRKSPKKNRVMKIDVNLNKTKNKYISME